jgi:hypothetical protein
MTQSSNTISYRIASRDDETGMYGVIDEVSTEIPVPLDTEYNQDRMRDIIVECHESGKSWVAVDVDGNLVGCILARPDVRVCLAM